MKQKEKDKSPKQSGSDFEMAAELPSSSSSASARAVSEAWQSFKPKIELSYILASRRAARVKNS